MVFYVTRGNYPVTATEISDAVSSGNITLTVNSGSSTGTVISIPNGGGIINFDGNAISLSAVAGLQTLPSNPVGFLNIKVGGASYRIPYYSP